MEIERGAANQLSSSGFGSGFEAGGGQSLQDKTVDGRSNTVEWAGFGWTGRLRRLEGPVIFRGLVVWKCVGVGGGAGREREREEQVCLMNIH